MIEIKEKEGEFIRVKPCRYCRTVSADPLRIVDNEPGAFRERTIINVTFESLHIFDEQETKNSLDVWIPVNFCPVCGRNLKA